MTARVASLLLIVSGASACLAVPPSRASYGPAITRVGTGYRASIGAQSIAADIHDTTSVDLGAGWVTEGGGGREAIHGTYLALARRLPFADRRLWLGGRAEQFWRVRTPGLPRQALVARAAYRHRIGGVAGASGGGGGGGGAFAAYGAFALGLHLDVGARALEGGGGELFVAAGASIDLPFLFGASKPAPIF